MVESPSERNFRDLMLVDDPDFGDVMRCVFDIRRHETHTYLTLHESPDSTVAELAAELEKGRSSVNRSLTTLLEKGLVNREYRLLDTGGYVYQYRAVPLAEAQERLHEALDGWTEFVHARIEEFDDMV